MNAKSSRILVTVVVVVVVVAALAAIVALVVKKASPKTWTSLKSAMAAAPSMSMAAAPATSYSAKITYANSATAEVFGYNANTGVYNLIAHTSVDSKAAVPITWQTSFTVVRFAIFDDNGCTIYQSADVDMTTAKPSASIPNIMWADDSGPTPVIQVNTQ